MRLSQSLTKTLKNAPADEVAKNAQLLIRAGYIHKELAGVYSYLPLGWRVLEKIINIIREEMDNSGAQELFMSSLQNPKSWQASGRWSDDVVDIWFKTLLTNGQEVGLGNTHEEPLTSLLTNHILSYRDLPKYAYQIQTKFRNELRAKSGIMRCREFIMKDLYSFSSSQKQHDDYYESMKTVYMKIFQRLGLEDYTYLTFASGGSFAKYSHEFQTLCKAGEDTIYVHKQKKIAINKDVLNDDVLADAGVKQEDLVEKTGAEVGNIFNLGTKFSEPIGLNFINKEGKKQPVIMGSYGIGPGRLMGVIVEIMSDEKGLVWPQQLAPYEYYVMGLGDEQSTKKAEEVYTQLTEAGISAILDDRDLRAGEKFADADLLGIPKRLVISQKTGDMVEQKMRSKMDTELLSVDSLIKSK